VSAPIAALAILSVIALSALALSILALFHAQSVMRSSGGRAAPQQAQQDAALDQMRASLEGLAAQIRDVQTAPAAVPAAYRTGLNLSKRSQALRMHRRGEPVAEIAAALELPHQEVELLIKVQRIVLSKI
jgi:hypothetical protein